jgi:hypothetical protein
VCPMLNEFMFNERLGIHVPKLSREWDRFSLSEQALILEQWEAIRGRIPQRIIELERIVIRKQDELAGEENFVKSCELNSEIADLASMINDLHIWYRTDQDVDAQVRHL